MKDFFASNLITLREKRGLSQAGMQEALGFGRTTWNSYENDKSKPSFADLLKIARYFGVSLSDIVERDLTKGKVITTVNEEENTPYGKVIGKGIGKVIDHKWPKSHPLAAHFVPTIITVDTSGKENILYVPARAQMGYLTGHNDPEFLATLPSFNLPILREGTYRMFDAGGVSMAPTIKPGQVICQAVDDGFAGIKDNRVYALVTTAGFVIKRILNRISERGKLVLKSDSIEHRLEHPTYEIDFETVREIWAPRLQMNGDFTEPSSIYNKIVDLEADLIEQQAEIREIRSLLQARLT